MSEKTDNEETELKEDVVKTAENAIPKNEMLKLYFDHLAEEGYRPKPDAYTDGSEIIHFKSEGMNFFIEADGIYFKLFLPWIWPIENDEERIAVHVACSHVNSMIRLAKLEITNDEDVSIVADAYTADHKAIIAVLDSYIENLHEAHKNFREKMRELMRVEEIKNGDDEVS
jgi:hypothetical protein